MKRITVKRELPPLISSMTRPVRTISVVRVDYRHPKWPAGRVKYTEVEPAEIPMVLRSFQRQGMEILRQHEPRQTECIDL